MGRAHEHATRWAASPQAPPLAATLLAAAALGEAIVRAVSTGQTARFAVAACAVAAFTTLPLGGLGPTGATIAVCVASVLSLTLFHEATVAGGVAQLIVLHRLGRRSAPGRAQLLAVGLAAPFLALALVGANPAGSEAGVLTVLLAALAPAAAWAGIATRARNEARLHRTARQAIADSLLEQTARRERARIARELHDIVAHHISMVAVQAETARVTTPGMPAAGAAQLAAIGDTARAALSEMRRLLGVLREDAAPAVADRRPQPGLGQLNRLLDAARTATGSGTRLILNGPSLPLDPLVELAAYRITQEALTNARRHAPGAAVDVELHYADGALRLRIRDNGPGPPGGPRNGGHGVVGMRERAAAVGGELRTGAAPGGGFLVEATLPVKVVDG